MADETIWSMYLTSWAGSTFLIEWNLDAQHA